MIGVKKIDFQENCVNNMISLCHTDKDGIIVKAPTGSGKTIILLKYIESYFNNFDSNTVFVWFCPGAGDLEEQSKAEMEKHIIPLLLADIQEELRMLAANQSSQLYQLIIFFLLQNSKNLLVSKSR